MPQIEIIGTALDKRIDPDQKYRFAKMTNSRGQERYLIIDKETKTPVCEEHWNNDYESLTMYIGSLNSPNQPKCIGCGMTERCK